MLKDILQSNTLSFLSKKPIFLFLIKNFNTWSNVKQNIMQCFRRRHFWDLAVENLGQDHRGRWQWHQCWRMVTQPSIALLRTGRLHPMCPSCQTLSTGKRSLHKDQPLRDSGSFNSILNTYRTRATHSHKWWLDIFSSFVVDMFVSDSMENV